ncbi:hypothetical protein B0H13DRAFT_1889320 [Mycena leptocephala]|nr:hypothetical protein B0H13DRAFT_1889320 [Mycena leptocephala]
MPVPTLTIPLFLSSLIKPWDEEPWSREARRISVLGLLAIQCVHAWRPGSNGVPALALNQRRQRISQNGIQYGRPDGLCPSIAYSLPLQYASSAVVLVELPHFYYWSNRAVLAHQLHVFLISYSTEDRARTTVFQMVDIVV